MPWDMICIRQRTRRSRRGAARVVRAPALVGLHGVASPLSVCLLQKAPPADALERAVRAAADSKSAGGAQQHRGQALVSTGIAMAIPVGCYGRIAPRSGLAVKSSIDVGAGVIDPDYRVCARAVCLCACRSESVAPLVHGNMEYDVGTFVRCPSACRNRSTLTGASAWGVRVSAARVPGGSESALVQSRQLRLQG